MERCSANPGVPLIQRLRVCLLGRDSFVHHVPRNEVAAALLRGLTSEEPDALDPVLECVYDNGVFEHAWLGLQEERPSGQESGARVDRWGLGSVKAWEGRVRFEEKGFDETIPHEPSGEGDSPDVPEFATLCAEWADWQPGQIHGESVGILKAFRDVLQVSRQLELDKHAKTRAAKAERMAEEAATNAVAAAQKDGTDPKEAAKEARKKSATEAEAAELEAKKAEETEPDAFQVSQQDLLKSSKASPRKLVRCFHPCPGLLASYARFSPEVGEFGSCGAVFLNVFEQGFSPWANYQNTAMVIAAAPDQRKNKDITPRTFLCAIRAVGSNIIRAIREYNRLAEGKEPPNAWERTLWFRADLRAQIESFLSDTNIWMDSSVYQKVNAATEGWLDLELMKDKKDDKDDLFDAELLDALSDSTYLETKIGEDGTVLVRRPALQLQSYWRDGGRSSSKWQWEGDPNDPTCWDFVRRGHCKRGYSCRYVHALPGTEAGANPIDVRDDQALFAQAAQQIAAMMSGMESSGAQDTEGEPDLETQMRMAVGLAADGGTAEGASQQPAAGQTSQAGEPAPAFANQLFDAAAYLQSAAAEVVSQPKQGIYKPWANPSSKPWDSKSWDSKSWDSRSWYSNSWNSKPWKQPSDSQERNVRPRLVDPPAGIPVPPAPVAASTASAPSDEQAKTGQAPATAEPTVAPATSDSTAAKASPPQARDQPMQPQSAQQGVAASKADAPKKPDASRSTTKDPAKRESDLKQKLLDRKRRFEGW